MDRVTIRTAEASDSEFAFQTKKAAFQKQVEKVWGWNEAEQRLLHERRFNEQAFSIVGWDGEDVGILATVRESKCIRVNQLFILPQYQGKGIGGHCLEMVLRQADELGLSTRLQVLKVNIRAKELFTRMGFKATGESDTHTLMEKSPPSRQG